MVRDFVTELLGLLEDAGWVESVRWNRQDVEVAWTPLGLDRGARWVHEVRALWPDPGPDDDLLRAYGLYFGFLEKTRRDRTKELVGMMLTPGPVLVVSTSTEGIRSFRLFPSAPCEEMYGYLESEHDAGHEVMLVNPNELLDDPRPWRSFPFSTPPTQERTAPGEGE